MACKRDIGCIAYSGGYAHFVPGAADKTAEKLNDIERKQNLQGAFSVKCALPPNACILLVDDIYTTGNTVDEAARCLQAAGECKVYVAAVAIGG